MALLQKDPGIYYIRWNGLLDYQLGTCKQARAFLRLDIEHARQEAAQIRANGLSVNVTNDQGYSLESSSETVAQIDESVVWPADWRIPIVRGNNAKYYHSFYDQQSASTQTLTGNSPQDLVDRFRDLYGADPAVTRYIDALPRVQEPAQIAKPAPAAAQTGPVRILRPADNGVTDDDISRLEAEREERQQRIAKPPANLEYEEFYNTHSAAESRKRAQQEPPFLSWIENHAATSTK